MVSDNYYKMLTIFCLQDYIKLEIPAMNYFKIYYKKYKLFIGTGPNY